MSDKQQLTDQDLFVVYRMPQKHDFFLLKHESMKNSAFSFVIHPFDQSSNTPAVELKANQLIRNPNFIFKVDKHCDIPDTAKASYMNLANSLIQEMKHTALEKVVISRTQSVDAEGIDLFDLYVNLCQTYPTAFVYLFNIPDEGTWMGATPEILVERKDQFIYTVALAATQKVGDRSIKEVEWNSKEIEEQAIIQRYIENHLIDGNVAFEKEPSYTTQAGNVFHIKTVYKISDAPSIQPLIDLLHPGPAICGMPKSLAKVRIIEGEKHDRAYYCGYLGLKSSTETNLFINLRCMQVFKDRFVLYVGGGLTKDSTAESEWQETSIKSKTLESVIQKSYIYTHDIEQA